MAFSPPLKSERVVMCTNADGFKGEPIRINTNWRSEMFNSYAGDSEQVTSSIKDAIENLKSMETILGDKETDLQNLADTVDTAKDKVENVKIQVDDAIGALESIDDINVLATEAIDDADEVLER